MVRQRDESTHGDICVNVDPRYDDAQCTEQYWITAIFTGPALPETIPKVQINDLNYYYLTAYLAVYKFDAAVQVLPYAITHSTGACCI